MFDAHRTHVKEVFQIVNVREIATQLALLRALYIFVWSEMIQHQTHPRTIKHLVQSVFAHRKNRKRCGYIVCQRQVNWYFNQLSWRYFIEPRMCGQNHLRHGHSHSAPPFERIARAYREPFV